MNIALEELTARLGRMEQELQQARGDLQRTRRDLTRATRRARLIWGCGLTALAGAALLTARPAALAQAPAVTLASLLARIQTLEAKTAPLSLQTDAGRADGKANTELYLSGVNVHVVSGSGSTSDGTLDSSFQPVPGAALRGLGNLVIGYNQLRSTIAGVGTDARTGSHNLIIGDFNNYSSFGGTVIGLDNATSAIYASVSGGGGSSASAAAATVGGGLSATASGGYAFVAGGQSNTASGSEATVCGGSGNKATADESAVSGGVANTASGMYSAVSGGLGNTASDFDTSVSGGSQNKATAFESSVSGGQALTESDDQGWAAGGTINSAYHSP